MNLNHGFLLAGLTLPFCAGQAAAASPDRGARQAASLFVQSCVSYAGHADQLRAWIAGHHLP